MLRLTSFLVLYFISFPLFATIEPQVAYYPRAVYAHEYFTIVVNLPSQSKAELRHNGRVVQVLQAKGTTLELSGKVTSPGVLTLDIGSTHFVWRIVGPSEKRPFMLRDTSVYVENLPVILLVAHRHPPKEDRTWEVAKWVYAHVADDRPIADGPVHVYADKRLLQEEQEGGLSFALDRLLCTLPPQALPGVSVLIPSLNDLFLGMSQVEYRMRLEWICQRLKSNRQDIPLFVVKPPYTTALSLGVSSNLFRLATLGNGAVCLPHHEDNEHEVDGIMRDIQQRVRIP